MNEDCATENPDIDDGERLIWSALDSLRTLLRDKSKQDNITRVDIDAVIMVAEEIRTIIPTKGISND